MPDPSQHCANCFYMLPQIQMVGGVLRPIPVCRNQPPYPTAFLDALPARWAQVDPDKDWCGQWKAQP